MIYFGMESADNPNRLQITNALSSSIRAQVNSSTQSRKLRRPSAKSKSMMFAVNFINSRFFSVSIGLFELFTHKTPNCNPLLHLSPEILLRWVMISKSEEYT